LSPARRAVREGLIRLGEQPVTRPSFAFKARLEGELIGGVEAPSGVTLLSLPRRHGRRLPAVTLAAASVAGVVLGGTLLGAFGHGGTGALQLAAAVDTTVVMPGGQTVPGRTGLGLPDGSVVWTGPNGRAAAGPVELGPGIEGVVVDAGHLRLQLRPETLADQANPSFVARRLQHRNFSAHTGIDFEPELDGDCVAYAAPANAAMPAARPATGRMTFRRSSSPCSRRASTGVQPRTAAICCSIASRSRPSAPASATMSTVRRAIGSPGPVLRRRRTIST